MSLEPFAIHTLKDLAEAVQERRRTTHPNVPAYALPRPTYTDKNANGLTKCVVDYINLQPESLAWRAGGHAVYDEKIGAHRSGTTTKGTADVSAIRSGQAWQIEVKIGRDRQSEVQRKFQERVEKAGGVYCIAFTFENFVSRWNASPTPVAHRTTTAPT